MLAHQCVTCWQRCSNIFCALHHSWRARCRNIFAQSIRTLSTRSIFLAGGGEQPCPPTRPTRVHGSARFIFRDHPQHYRPKLNCPLQTTLAMQCNRAVAGRLALPGLPSPRPTWKLRLWSSRSTRPSYTKAYLGATPVVRDCLLRSAPFVVSAVCLALSAPSILRCQGTPRPVALGPTPLLKGTTSKSGGRYPGEPHARSHSGPMYTGEDVQEPTPLGGGGGGNTYDSK